MLIGKRIRSVFLIKEKLQDDRYGLFLNGINAVGIRQGQLYGWLPLSDASGIILSILGIPNVILLYNVCFTFEDLSNNIRILTPN